MPAGLQRRRLCGAALAAGLLPTGAAHALMAGALPDTPAARIDANTAASPWSGAVSVVAGGSAFSGVAIGPQHVLTAAHVTAGQAPTALRVVANPGPVPQSIAVSTSTPYPGTVFPYDDLCVLRLAQPLPAGVAIYPIADAPVATGTRLTLVGYGASGNGSGAPTVNASSSVKRRGANVVDLLTDQLDASGRSSPFWVCDFDGPSGSGPLGGASLGNALETCMASGDSGSPVFIDSGIGPALYGLSTLVLNFGNGAASSTFGSGGGGPVLAHAPYLTWLLAQTEGQAKLLSQVDTADVPVAPAWALGLLGAALLSPLLQRRKDSPRG